MNATQIARDVKSGALTALAAVENSLKVIKEKNKEINAFVEVFEEEAIARAKEIDAKKAAGKPLGKLAGVPVAIKDNMLFKGHKATCASKMLENYVSAYTCTVVEKMLEQDAVIIGRVNMDEFAMGSSTEHSIYGITKNPVDTTRVAGGSSGGSAAAVAAGMVPVALGSDTGGSIRQPASFCGIVGMKPTYGRVSRKGIVAFASSADQVGPLTTTVEDSALMLSVLAGFDGKDSTLSQAAVPEYENMLGGDIKGLKIGIPVNFFDNLAQEVKDSYEKGKEVLKSLGAEFVEVSLPYAKYSAPCYYVLTGAEASSNLGRYDGIRYGYTTPHAKNLDDIYSVTRMEGFGPEVKKRIIIGHYVVSKEKYESSFIKAQQVRQLIRQDFARAFEKVDVILTPTSPTAATKIGHAALDNVNTYLADLFTCPGNMADLPGISVPCGACSENLPLGLQFYAAPFKEEKMLQAAHAFEKAFKK
ncbi:aspartyl-tRNA(Asn)/glutamyl-tRNA(Gln) amidotransferase subunit A [Elusimicrobium posterum]|uniref:Asp-tRNA(Asn)/Glu-tRNA(Gln) amidotransferase subunit GatA n=1 Tax=Elusimicrobium posterum TaxID=3116653 RepID=UPI003C759CBE